MDRLAKMSAFTKVVETGSFTAAAQILRLSPTMISKHVRELEDQLGVKLLNRTTRSVNVTEVGGLFYERCAPLLAELGDLESMASCLHATPRGTIRLAAPLAYGAAQIAPAMADFLRLYPELKVDLILTDRTVNLIEEGFDVAIHTGGLPDSSYRTRQLASFDTVVCASPAYLAAHGTPASPEDLARHDCLPLDNFEFGRQMTFTGPDGKSQTVPLAGRLRTNSLQAQREGAVHGMGVIVHPRYLAEEDLAAGRLVRILADYQTPSVPVRVLYLPGPHLSAKIRAIVDFLTDYCAVHLN
ncbi:MAG: LysR family transcriptional regulator [Telmatospirillum sp.]|nr:LysR family transcriptional regulator [Telmatospirillum sp.]